jgi:hypothetical protein
MAKNNANNLNAQTVNTAANELLVLGQSQSGITWEQAFDFAEAQDTAKMKSLTGAKWLELNEFGEFTFAFMGMDNAETKEGKVTVVKLCNKQGEEFISSLAVLVSTCEKLTQIPSFIKISYQDDKKGANGTYKNLKIFSL